MSGSVNSQDYNHISLLAGATITGTTTHNTTGDPFIDKLTDNGGPTETNFFNNSTSRGY